MNVHTQLSTINNNLTLNSFIIQLCWQPFFLYTLAIKKGSQITSQLELKEIFRMQQE